MEFTSRNIRRKDRIMDDGNALKLLREAEYGVLSISSENGAYGVPITYAWDGGSRLYFHCAHKGRKLDLLAKQKNVSFCIVGKIKILYELASVAYKSLILEGTMETELSDEEKRLSLKEGGIKEKRHSKPKHAMPMGNPIPTKEGDSHVRYSIRTA